MEMKLNFNPLQLKGNLKHYKFMNGIRSIYHCKYTITLPSFLLFFLHLKNLEKITLSTIRKGHVKIMECCKKCDVLD